MAFFPKEFQFRPGAFVQAVHRKRKKGAEKPGAGLMVNLHNECEFRVKRFWEIYR